MAYPLFSFIQPQQNQSFPQNQSMQQGMDQYQQQGQNLLDPGSAQLAQANPVSMAGHQALGGAFQQAGQMGPPGGMPQQGVPQDMDAYLQQQALATGLMQQPQNPWTIEASYPKPNFGGKQGVWGG